MARARRSVMPKASHGIRRGGLSRRLRLGPSGFRSQPSFHRAKSRPSSASVRRRRYHGFTQELNQPGQSIGSVPFLGSKLLGSQRKHTSFAQTSPRKHFQFFIRIRRKMVRLQCIKFQLDSRLHLLNILPPGSRRPDKRLMDLTLVDPHRLVDLDHRRLPQPLSRSVAA